MTKDLQLVDNVRVLSSQQPETCVLEDHGVAIHGQSFPTQAVTTNLARSYPARRPGYFNLGLLHTCVDGREGHEPYAPCSLTDLQAREYGYWALGHIHAREILCRDDPWIIFPGNLQGRNAREHGAKGCMLVTVGDRLDVVSVEPRWLDVVRWQICQLNARGARDGDEVMVRFRDRLTELLSSCNDRLLALRVEVRGATEAHASLSSHVLHWTSEFRQVALDTGAGRVWIEKVLFRTSPLRDLTAENLGDTPLAELAACLEELRGDDSKLTTLATQSLGDLTRKLPPELLEGLDSPQRLRGLLDQVGPLLFERLLRGTE
jgi:DNA repair exonuclease SbcCD nuclease subunit